MRALHYVITISSCPRRYINLEQIGYTLCVVVEYCLKCEQTLYYVIAVCRLRIYARVIIFIIHAKLLITCEQLRFQSNALMCGDGAHNARLLPLYYIE